MSNSSRKFFVNPSYDSFSGGELDDSEILEWLQQQSQGMSDAHPGIDDFATLSEQLLVEGRKDFLIWDDVLKSAEMSFFAKQVPLMGPSIDFCCGYGFWTSKILGKIDIGLDLFNAEGAYHRGIEGFVQKDFIDGAYRSVMQGDVTAPLPLPSNFFQSIISVCSLEHIDRADLVLKTMERIIKADGKLYLSLQTDQYINTFKDIFHPNYVQWVRDEFTIHVDRTWQDWVKLIEEAGFVIESKRFILSRAEMELKALSYWKNPFSPSLGALNLDKAVKEIPEFRRHYFDQVRAWGQNEVDPDEAAIVCFVCSRKK